MATFSIHRDNDTVTLHTPELDLAFSLEDGGLRKLQRIGGPNVLGHGIGRPSIDVCLDSGHWLAERVFVRYLSHTASERDGAVELVIVIGIGPLKFYDRYRITGTLITRRLSVENVGDDPVQLRGVRLALPWARVGALESCRFEAPGSSVRPHVALTIAAEQRMDVLPRRFFAPGLRDGRAIEPGPTYTPGLLGIQNAETDEALLCWYTSTTETAQPQLQGNGTAVTLQHQIELADWLRSEVALSGGTQYILLLRDSWPAVLDAFRRTWMLGINLGEPRPPTWIQDAAIYETHAALFGGFEGLRAALPKLQALGVNTLCLMPVWEFAHGRQPLWDGNWQASGDPYAIRDLERIDSTLGTADDLRNLVESAHHHGMRLLVDLPLIGCAPDTRYLFASPDWFCKDEQGHPALAPGRSTIISFDWANTALRDYVVQTLSAQLAHYRFDGFRAITPRTPQPNWARGLPYQSGAGGLGFLRLLEALRQAISTHSPEAVLIGDLSGPIGHGYQDGAIDELAHHMFVHTALNRLTPAELGEWLENHSSALPYSQPRISFTESHRTRLINPLADGLRGSRISRMLLAGLIFCGFVPSIWSGQERDEHTSIARLLALRQQYPALRKASVQYNAIPCNSAQVFTVLRMCRGEHIIGLMNIGPHKQIITLSIPVDMLGLPEGDYRLCELLSGTDWRENSHSQWRRDELLSINLTLEPFSAYCFIVEAAQSEMPIVEAL